MFSHAELDRLIAAMRANGVVTLSVEQDGQALHLDLNSAETPGVPISDPVPVRAAKKPAKSPGIGRFVPRGLDDGLPALTAETKIGQGDTLGYIAQRQIRALVIAPANGVLASDIPAEGTVFGFGDVVFNLEVDG